MRSKATCLVFLLLFALGLNAQTIISGLVRTNGKKPLEGASITLEGTWYGSTSSKDGSFSFSCPDTGHFNLSVSLIGYKKLEKEIHLTGSQLSIEFLLKEEVNEMQAVTVSAGSFEASNQRRNTVLKPLDIVTTAGQQADIVAALRTLPGAQQIGESEGLFVRGGTGAETKVFIDGMMVTNPFYSSVPDIAQRGRFSPLIFKGTHFSSGGYSAQFGQAMSSALTLETHDLPTRSETNMIISSAQLSLTRQQLLKEKKASAGFSINYNNMQPYYAVVPQKPHYSKPPEIINGEMYGRLKSRKGMFKYYGYATQNLIGFDRPSIEAEKANDQFNLKGQNIFTILTYSGNLNDNWKLNYGAGFSYNKDRIDLSTSTSSDTIFNFRPRISNNTMQARSVFTRLFGSLSKWHNGFEFLRIVDKIEARDSIPFINRTDNFISIFSESDIYITPSLLAKPGIRYEYSSLLQRGSLSPRLSFAWKLRKAGQVSLAYGKYFQKPETSYLFRKTDLQFSKATHYIFNYERIANNRTIRAELFYKKYEQLIRFPFNQPSILSNTGNGYAKGLELFWRDKKLFPGFDYWISYSFLDTKRQFQDYPLEATPTFAAKHTFNLVMKQFITPIATNISVTYSYASGRPYYNPNKPVKDFLSDRTIDYHNLGFQVNYLCEIGKANTVFIFNLNNVIGNNQVFGYHYASKPNNAGLYRGEAITPMAKRFVFIGAYLTIGNDRRREIIDN
ncbi:MAG: TonB-dependent receptor [Pseudobacter sp.]|uniref:TonB-dependent receptor n=1 Tax=Pseudobacter sp. TaxID=2045420 RepID=UPI003F7FDBA4